jgi:hypothetical protein
VVGSIRAAQKRLAEMLHRAGKLAALQLAAPVNDSQTKSW